MISEAEVHPRPRALRPMPSECSMISEAEWPSQPDSNDSMIMVTNDVLQIDENTQNADAEDLVDENTQNADAEGLAKNPDNKAGS